MMGDLAVSDSRGGQEGPGPRNAHVCWVFIVWSQNGANFDSILGEVREGQPHDVWCQTFKIVLSHFVFEFEKVAKKILVVVCVFRRTTRWSCSRQFCLKVCIAWLTSLILVEFHLETHKFIRFFDKFQFSALDLVQNIEFKVTAPLDFFVDHHDFLTGANQSYQTGPMTHFELKCCIIFAHSVGMHFDRLLSKK